MSYKIQIPKTSDSFNQWLFEKLQVNDDFYSLLNYIAGEGQSVELCSSFAGLGGGKTYEQLLESHKDAPLIIELKSFFDQGYTAGDFQHIFLDAYLNVKMEMIVNGYFRVSEHENSDRVWEKHEYDSNGNITKDEYSNGSWQKYEYDSIGNQTKSESSNGSWEKHEYDSNGNITKSESSNGSWKKWEYDSNGKLTKFEISA